MGFLGFSHFPMVFPWFSQDFPMVFPEQCIKQAVVMSCHGLPWRQAVLTAALDPAAAWLQNDTGPQAPRVTNNHGGFSSISYTLTIYIYIYIYISR